MRKLLVTVLALTAMAACGGDPGTVGTTSAATLDRPPRTQPAEPSSTTTSTTSTTSTPPPAPTTTTAPVTPATTAEPAPVPAPERTARPDCSEGGGDVAAELQRSFDQGHQPWRADPLAVAGAGAACHFGTTASSIEAAGPHRYLATDAGSGDQAVVELTQPLGTGTVWLIAAVTPA